VRPGPVTRDRRPERQAAGAAGALGNAKYRDWCRAKRGTTVKKRSLSCWQSMNSQPRQRSAEAEATSVKDRADSQFKRRWHKPRRDRR